MLDLSTDPDFDEICIKKNFDLFTPETKFTVKLIDMGLAKSTNYAWIDTKIRGNYFFMPPEANDDNFGSKSDLWSLACMMIDMFEPIED